MTTWALAVNDAVGDYPAFDEYRLAVWQAIDHARSGETVTVIRVDGQGDDLTLTPVFTVTPPAVPTHSTSPEASRE